MSEPVPRHHDHVGVNNASHDCALELTVWDRDMAGVERTVRIAVEDVTQFMADVVRHGGYALRDAARRLEVGDCRTCNNTGLVDVEKRGRSAAVNCPDCRHRWPAESFANAPQIVPRNDAT